MLVVLILLVTGVDGRVHDGHSQPVGGESEPGTAPVTLAFGGDVLLGGEMNGYVARHGAKAPLLGVPQLREADVAIVNLESVVAPGGDVVDTGNPDDYYFLGRPEMLAVLEAAGIDLVSTGNNHARDYGTAALAAMDHLLTTMGMAHPGIGHGQAEACEPAYIAHGDLRIAVFSMNTAEPAYPATDGEIGTCHLKPDDRDGWRRIFGPAFAEARIRADIVLAMPHFRASWSTTPHPDDRAVSQLLIDIGADAVLGNGAHQLQGVAAYRGRPILHGAGSLVFNSAKHDQAAVFLLDLTPTGVVAVRTVPLITEFLRTRPALPSEATAILASIDARSRVFGTLVSGGIVKFAPPPRRPPMLHPLSVARLNPGPAPRPIEELPAVCTAASVPEDAVLTPSAFGPLTLVGARVERDRLDGPSLIWLETFWRIDATTMRDLSIAPRAVPKRGRPWQGGHEPCEWAWPTSRWQPGVLYRDRALLRPTAQVQRLGGFTALLSMNGYGALAVSVEVKDQDRSLGESGVLRIVTMHPASEIQVGLMAGILLAAISAISLISWKRASAHQTR